MAWEKVALDLAAKAGIDVPVSRLLQLAGRHVLIVDRFDRTPEGRRIGYVSAKTMLEAADGEQRSYPEIADVIETSSARPTEELLQLFRRIVFSVLISNTDDHLRNHGFLHERADVWRLAPAFDLNPNPEPGPKFLSTAIDYADDTASIAVALSVAESFRLGAPRAREVVQEVAAAVATWRSVAAGCHLTSAEMDAMAPAFDGLSDAGDL